MKKIDRTTAYGNLLRDMGICRSCKKRHDCGTLHCRSCAAKKKTTAYLRWQERKQNNLCERCGGPPRPNRTLCQSCADQHRKHCQVSYRKSRLFGKCTDCRKDAQGRHRCPDCLRKKREAEARRKESKP